MKLRPGRASLGRQNGFSAIPPLVDASTLYDYDITLFLLQEKLLLFFASKTPTGTELAGTVYEWIYSLNRNVHFGCMYFS